MKRLTFKVKIKNEKDFIGLIKAVSEISCRIRIDIERGVVIVENVNEPMIDTVMELINNYYTIQEINIDNSVQNNTTTIEEIKDLSSSSDKNSSSIESDSENYLIFKKVEFENEYIEQLMNNLLRTAYWAMFKMNATERDIGMPMDEKIIRQSFVIACDIKKITYENIIFELSNINPSINEDIIKGTLKENFKKWLKQYPELSQKCPKISLMSLLKVFAKKFS